MKIFHDYKDKEFLFELFINDKSSIRAICFEMVPFVENPSERRCIKTYVEWICNKTSPRIISDEIFRKTEKIPSQFDCDFKRNKNCTISKFKVNHCIISFLEWCCGNIKHNLIWKHELALIKTQTDWIDQSVNFIKNQKII